MAKTLYYVTGYHWEHNEWWRFALTAASSEDAVKEIDEHYKSLTRVSAVAICETNDEVFVEL